jgi:hypothetical protein
MSDGAEWHQQIDLEEREQYEQENTHEHSNVGHRSERNGQIVFPAQFRSGADPFDSDR